MKAKQEKRINIARQFKKSLKGSIPTSLADLS